MTATLKRILGKLACILTESHRFEERADGNRQCSRCGMILYTFAANSALVSGSLFTLIDARWADPEWWFAYRKSTPIVALRAFAERNPTFCPAVTAWFGGTP